MVRGRDACWEHCVLIDAGRQKVRCNYCHREFSGGVYRMKFHLAQIRNKDIVPCTEVPNNVRDHIQGILSTPKKQKTCKRQKIEHVANGQQNSSSASGGELPNRGSSEQNGSICPSLLFTHASPSAQDEPTLSDVQNQKQDDADKKTALFFFYNAIPLGAATSMYYKEMVDAIAECGVGYKAPSPEKLRFNHMEKVKVYVNDIHKQLRDEWQETGCTILCNCWSDGGTKSLVVFSVTCPKGAIFLRSVDISGHADDTHYLFGLLESVVLEVGIESVVQVLTDSAPNFAYAGKLLMDKYASIFWSPCASHCITKMLHDLSKLDWVSIVLEEATTITKYIYSDKWIVNMMQKFTSGMELIRPKILTCVANFLTLRFLVLQEENLKDMFSHTEWLTSSFSQCADGQLVKSMLNDEKFWSSAREAASVLKVDAKMRNCFQEAMMKMAVEDKDRIEITKEHPVYINADGALRTDFAIKGRTLNAPGDWWAGYGYEIPILQRFAIRILSQPCSSQWCRWNWSNFENLHFQRLNRAELDKLSDLVFVRCNLWLQEIIRNRYRDYKPIIFDEVDVDLEWPSESEFFFRVSDGSLLENV
ncbi:hypothetical protein BUALT_Bualt10G0031000 [Buddleja alternifolia]|uniref:BED-type domain-containing protein n=1 Tax=Buddleja alternifolia TaxID=168488 RepID=A0AAV6X4C0_9LAMI|nr:hypothetical protein BUALT_Bualt10G0031000 [Buddleja alternifolia]